MQQTNLIGAGLALAIFSLSSLTFVARLAGRPELGRWFGVPLLLTAFPLSYLLVRAPQAGRPWAIAAGVLFLIMGALAFIQRAATGL